MTNDQLFTAFALTHFHEGKHTKDDHPDEVDVNNVRLSNMSLVFEGKADHTRHINARRCRVFSGCQSPAR
jgi:hypothetical protein